MTPYETYNNQIGVRLGYLVADEPIRVSDGLGVISYDAYKKRA